MEDLSDSTEVCVQKSHGGRLKRFFAIRPAMEDLIKKGNYIAEDMEDLSDFTEVSVQKSHGGRLKKYFATRPAMEDLIKKGNYIAEDMEDLSDSSEVSVQKSHGGRLKKFFATRPAMEDLIKKGNNIAEEMEDLSDSIEVSVQKSQGGRLKRFFAIRPAMEDLIKKGNYIAEEMEDLSDSTEVSVQKSQGGRLKRFFAIRPAMEDLIKKGNYIDEPVFGRKLEDVCLENGLRVPNFVVACVKEIESSEENMCTDGLYSASGNLSQVQKLRLEIDQNNTAVIEDNTDIHVLTGSLKLFFRELKEPLIPCHLFDRVLAACSIKPREAKIKEFREIIHALPQCNRDTMKFLLEHLLRTTLLMAPAEQHNIAIDYIQQNNVVEVLLNDFKEIFTEDTKGKKKA